MLPFLQSLGYTENHFLESSWLLQPLLSTLRLRYELHTANLAFRAFLLSYSIRQLMHACNPPAVDSTLVSDCDTYPASLCSVMSMLALTVGDAQ